MEEQRNQIRLELKLEDLKSILQHNLTVQEGDFVITVPPSRYRKIFSDYLAMTANTVEDLLDTCMKYKFYVLTLDSGNDKKGNPTNNTFKIVRDKTLFVEYQGKCEGCNCDMKKRWIKSSENKCYYRIAIESNYMTKLNGEIIKIKD